MKFIKIQYIQLLFQRLPEKTRDVVLTVICAIAAGASSVCFMSVLNYFFDNTFITFASYSDKYFIIGSFIVIISTSIVAGILLNSIDPNAAGSGIPQLKAAYWKEMGDVSWRPVLLKFFAGIINIGGGASLGREGPSVYLGGGLASNIAGLMGVPRRQRRSAVLIGASAGLAAAFNAPLAAITFVLEEMVADINNRFIGHVVMASMIGALVVFAFIGHQPAFKIPFIDTASWIHYVIVPVVALFASLLGVIFQRATLFLRHHVKRQKYIPKWLTPCIGGFIIWILGVSVYLTTGKVGIFGLGYEDLSNALNNNFIWWIAGIVMIVKLLATFISYGFGACGGIFSPLLFIGGMCGYFIGGLVDLWIPLASSDRIILSAVGMSCCLGVVVRAPLTSILIVFEMTHQFSFVPGLLIGTFISMIVTRFAGSENLYDALLIQDGHELIKIRPPRDIKSWQNMPISSIINPHPVIVNDLSEHHLKKIIEEHPYKCFPVNTGSKQIGLITREQIASILANKSVQEIPSAVTCYPDQTVQEVGNKFIESPNGCIVVLDENTSNIAGIITLHDIIRAQAAIQE